MTRRRHQSWNHIKPSPQPDHFKPTSSPNQHPPSETLHQPSVNALLSQLRSSQSTHNESDTPSPRAAISVVIPSVPPGLQNLLGTPLPPPPPPRPRVGGPTTRNRLAPGPPPPASWLHQSIALPAEPPSSSSFTTSPNTSLTTLPDLPLPATPSLLHSTLLLLSKNWSFHQTYDQHYLPHLPPRLKSLLLIYFTRYNIAITASGFSLLFSSGAEETTHLDLSHTNLAVLLPTFRSPTAVEAEPESWDVATASVVRFSALTHLSLAWPRRQDLKVLLKVLELTPGVTHLSLAGWEIANWRAVAKRTLCLRWIDVRGCSTDTIKELFGSAAWIGEWRRVGTVVMRKGPGTGLIGDRVREMRRKDGVRSWLEVQTVSA
ncbi:hypothetical protein K440DRAFT_663500 [Wilcoxina mikolae CBS 423.85]|nr:hypothetical protein K440DRAFT_663500 [Wilcoxina mikolae CBS 423.85]